MIGTLLDNMDSKVSEEYLVTYNPSYNEEHSDSSEFERREDRDLVIEAYEYIEEQRLKQKETKTNTGTNDQNCYVGYSASNESFRNKYQIPTRDSNDITYTRKYGRVEIPKKGEGSNNPIIMKTHVGHRIVRCPSSQVKLNSSTSKQSKIRSHNSKGADARPRVISSQYNSANSSPNENKIYYTLQPVYIVDGKVTELKIDNGNIKMPIISPESAYSCTSLDSDYEFEKYRARRRFKKLIRKEIQEEYFKYKTRKKTEQNNAKNCDTMHALFTNEAHNNFNTNEVKILNARNEDCPCSTQSSNFWDSMYGKIHNPPTASEKGTESPTSRDFSTFSNSKTTSKDSSTDPLESLFLKMCLSDANRQMKTDSEELRHEVKEMFATPPRSTTTSMGSKKCPRHQKAKRCEEFCICDPKDLLVNGAPTTIYRVHKKTEMKQKISSVLRFNKKKAKMFGPVIEHTTQHTQYMQPEKETDTTMKEKMVQSICNHKPPCEVVRGCDPVVQDEMLISENSCMHVPLCEKVPRCLLSMCSNSRACNHSPKCQEVPVCTKNLVNLTAKESMFTQVKPQCRLVCRHTPPCVMVPECLGPALCSSVVTLDSLPVCVHSPACDLIPACHRSTNKKLVSVHSQVPMFHSRCVIV